VPFGEIIGLPPTDKSSKGLTFEQLMDLERDREDRW
jgi:hypothetical protein